MFAVIETNGASHIVIHVPHEGADKSLPALARLLEMNATFVNVGYREMSLKKPVMSIVLGNQYVLSGTDEEIQIAESDAVISDDFVNAEPDVFVSNKKYREKAEAEQQRLRTELSYTKDELARLKEQLAVLTADQED